MAQEIATQTGQLWNLWESSLVYQVFPVGRSSLMTSPLKPEINASVIQGFLLSTTIFAFYFILTICTRTLTDS